MLYIDGTTTYDVNTAPPFGAVYKFSLKCEEVITHSGKSNYNPLRSNPILSIKYDYYVDNNHKFDSLVFSNLLHKDKIVPLYSDLTFLESVTTNQTYFIVDDGTLYVEGQYAVLFSSCASFFKVVKIVSVIGDIINISGSLPASNNVYIAPAYAAIIDGNLSGKSDGSKATYSVAYTVKKTVNIDGDIGGVFPTFKSLPVFTAPVESQGGSYDFNITQRIDEHDNEIDVKSIRSPHSASIALKTYNFIFYNKEEFYKYLKFYKWCAGRHKTFYIPTNEIRLKLAILAGQTTITTTMALFGSFKEFDRLNYNDIIITMDDGTIHMSSVTYKPYSYGRVLVSLLMPAASLDIKKVRSIDFLVLNRLLSDDIEVNVSQGIYTLATGYAGVIK